MKYLKLLLSAIIALALFYAGQFRPGLVPPAGKFLDPFAGFWKNDRSIDRLPEQLHLPGLEKPARVLWDERHVPHVFAQTPHDLYMIQGYLMARDRLWQMEFIASAAAGRLSEFVGKKTLAFDRFRRRIGMIYAAENSIKTLARYPQAKNLMQAYTDGVNAWIDQLDARTLPVEYKVLDYKPEKWSSLKSALVLKYMAWTLTGRSTELALSRSRAVLGDELTNQLYPFYPPFTDPIIPPGTPWNFKPLTVAPPSHEYRPFAGTTDFGFNDEFIQGSNNWAVSGKRTQSGFPILCSDPHLLLNLPSIWYEIQLNGPDINVYGVTIPGTPGVIIGFNEHIAWGMTNAGSDVLDFYQMTFKDRHYREYRYGDEWRATRPRVEKIKVRGAKTVVDTVYYTHLGPVPYLPGEKPFIPSIPPGAAMRWTAHDSSAELLTFLGLNKARGYDDYLEALSHFDCPAQNIVYADVEGNIAIRHNGKFPLRWKAQGRYLLNGSDPAYEWQGWIPKTHIPQVKNPPRGFVSSANQAPADPSYPYYLGWNYASFERGARINEWLSGREHLTPQDMMMLQNDLKNLRAEKVLPAVLPLLAAEKFDAQTRAAFDTLRNWNYENRANLIAPIIYEYFWQELYRRIWRDDMKSKLGRLLWPRTDVTIELILNHPSSPFFDDKTTKPRETLVEMVQAAFTTAVENLQTDFGPIGPAWQWGLARGTDIEHLGSIPGFGREKLPTNGNYAIVNATSKHAGPSWRMIVQLQPEQVRAWAVYPGGESGSPGSQYYDNMVQSWVEGKYYELLFLKSAEAPPAGIVATTEIRGEK